MAEIELKLRAPASQLDALRTALARLSVAPPSDPKPLQATYFDTRDQALARKGLTLRVRREDGHFVQTVKTSGKRLTKRGEWSDLIDSPRPDLSAANSGRRVRRLVKTTVRPQFQIDVKRTVFALRPGEDTVIEAAVDEGKIISPDAKRAAEAISEVELELKSGDPAALYTTALKLLPVAPVSIEARSKSERGYALKANTRPAVVRGEAIALEPKATVEDTLRRLGLRYLTQCLRNIPAVQADSVEGIHQVRVALRRLRAFLRAVKEYLPADAFNTANGQLRKLLQALGPARNWDVFAEQLAPPVMERADNNAGASAFNRAVTLARMRAHGHARDAVSGPESTAIYLELLRWFETRGWRTAGDQDPGLATPIGKLAPRLLDRQFRRARKRGRGFDKMPTEARHAFRIALKNVRYTAEVLGGVLDRKRTAKLVRDIKPLQELLGHLNDVRTARDLVQELATQDSSPAVAIHGGAVIGWHDAQVHAADPRLCRAVAEFCRLKPWWR